MSATFFSKFQHGVGRQNTFGDFKSKIALNLEIEAAMDATILEGSFATIISNGSAGMPKKSNDFQFLL